MVPGEIKTGECEEHNKNTVKKQSIGTETMTIAIKCL
jgi:hypothetical protein